MSAFDKLWDSNYRDLTGVSTSAKAVASLAWDARKELDVRICKNMGDKTPLSSDAVPDHFAKAIEDADGF